MTDDTLAKFKAAEATDLTTEELRIYARALKEKTGLYLRAYRTINERLRKIEQEIERRKLSEG